MDINFELGCMVLRRCHGIFKASLSSFV